MSRVRSEELSSFPQFSNPFAVESPEKLDPQHLVSFFIEKYTKIETIKQRKNTFLWGARGSGKSMLFRYLEPKCQAIANGSFDGFLQSSQPFIALYCPCKEGHFNKTDIRLLDKQPARILTEHLFNMHIAIRLVECLDNQIPSDYLGEKETLNFAKAFLQLFDRASIASSLRDINEVSSLEENPLKWIRKLCETENRKVAAFLRNNALPGRQASYEGATSGYHDFLLPLMQTIGGELRKLRSIPIYILLDDANRLTQDQQIIINTWVANRDHESLCLKIAAEFSGYKTFKKMDDLFGSIEEGDDDLHIERGGFIEAPHDYSEVNIDELYTNSKSDYVEKVRLITSRRLELAGISEAVESFLPEDPSEIRLLKEMKAKTADEWEDITKKQGYPPQDKSDYIYRYATARLHQHLDGHKRRKSYAGFHNMVHLSSGIVRGFLEPCYLMFDKIVSEKGTGSPPPSIPPKIQNEILYKYSEEFLVVDIEKIRKDLPSESWTHLESLLTLLQSLGRLFYERLHDPNAREARLFSFTLRGKISDDLDEVLRLAVRYRYFQLRTYSSKEGGGRERWYILNRRLCPVFKLDPTGFEGRISLSPSLLQLACQDTEKFVRLRLRQTGNPQQMTLFSPEDAGLEQ